MNFMYTEAELAFASFPGPDIEHLSAPQQVDNGIAFLERNHVAWYEVDLITFDMGSACECVVGQTYKGFHTFLTMIAEDFLSLPGSPVYRTCETNAYHFARYLGLLASGNNDAHWNRLQVAWESCIIERQEEEKKIHV